MQVAPQQLFRVKCEVQLALFALQQKILVQSALDGGHQRNGCQTGNAGHILFAGLAGDAVCRDMEQLGKLTGVGSLVLIQLQLHAGAAGLLEINAVVQHHKVFVALAVSSIQPGKRAAQAAQGLLIQPLFTLQKAAFAAAPPHGIALKHQRRIGRLNQFGAFHGQRHTGGTIHRVA